MTIPFIVSQTKKFKKDSKRCLERGKNLDKMFVVIEELRWGRRLEAKYKLHKLAGKYNNYLECHIEPNWLMVWRIKLNELRLERTGTHSDIY